MEQGNREKLSCSSRMRNLAARQPSAKSLIAAKRLRPEALSLPLPG